MKGGKKIDLKTFEEWIASDDELPDSYNDEIEVPSYKDDGRFDKIQFAWIHNKTVKQIQEPHVDNSSLSFESKESIIIPTKFYNDMLNKRILKKKDIFCLQSVENRLPGSVFLWFADFLMWKDMQSKYEFLKGCLVHDTFKNYERAECTGHNSTSDQKCKYKIIFNNKIQFN